MPNGRLSAQQNVAADLGAAELDGQLENLGSGKNASRNRKREAIMAATTDEQFFALERAINSLKAAIQTIEQKTYHTVQEAEQLTFCRRQLRARMRDRRLLRKAAQPRLL
jgi:hypothetical protein